MKVFLTKYALTSGIEEVEAEQVDEDMIKVRRPRAFHYYQYFHRSEWHTTHQEAVAHAEKMRTARIASLQKSIAKLTKITFQ